MFYPSFFFLFFFPPQLYFVSFSLFCACYFFISFFNNKFARRMCFILPSFYFLCFLLHFSFFLPFQFSSFFFLPMVIIIIIIFLSPWRIWPSSLITHPPFFFFLFSLFFSLLFLIFNLILLLIFLFFLFSK